MSGGVIVPDKDTAKALNDLARHQTIYKLLTDIQADLMICDIEGWDKTEFIKMIQKAVDFDISR